MTLRYVLGLNGYHAPVTDHASEWNTRWFHDAAAVLLLDGEVVHAVEEERLTRKKHTGTFPARAIASCLAHAGLTLDDVDAVAVGEQGGVGPYRDPDLSVGAIARALAGFGGADPSGRIHLVEHHLAHAMSAYYPSGFDDALVLTMDGFGDGVSGLVMSVRGGRREVLRRIGVEQSLGNFYAAALPWFGYGPHDEYKLMGLASYGDPERFAPLVSGLYELLPDGDYRFLVRDRSGLAGALAPVGPPRRRGAPFEARHQDLAASIQQAFATIVLHVLRHFAASTRHEDLCLAGGCAQNSVFNGVLAAAGLFGRVFVQPASHDAGTALGAALEVANREARVTRRARPSTVRWGPAAELTFDEARAWEPFVEVRRLDDVAGEAAALLAEGHVLGWVQGRSEFGPRALGGRSILADPRRGGSRDRINEVIKERELYRPFAPAVLAEAAAAYFVTSGAEATTDFMGFAVPVRPEARELLPAVTHVDGTARVQTVHREASPDFWALLHAFGERTGVPVLLNTSFNSSREPIVQTAHDAITCLLTSKLEHLVVGDLLLLARPFDPVSLLGLRAVVPPHVQLTVRRTRGGAVERQLVTRRDVTRPISAAMTSWLVAGALPREDERRAVARELYGLWVERLVALHPGGQP